MCTTHWQPAARWADPVPRIMGWGTNRATRLKWFTRIQQYQYTLYTAVVLAVRKACGQSVE